MDETRGVLSTQASIDPDYAHGSIELTVDGGGEPRTLGDTTIGDGQALLPLGRATSERKSGSQSCPRLLTIGLAFSLALLLLTCAALAVALLVGPTPGGFPSCTAPIDIQQAGSSPRTRDLSQAACNNNGILYSGSASCDCFPCYGGDSCLELDPNCTVNLSSGDPLIMEDYWVEHSSEARVVTLPSYRIGYENNANLPELEAVVRKLHAKVGNAETDGCHIVIGIGSTQLIGAAWFALANETEANPALVWGKPPFYSGYRSADMFESKRFTFLNAANPPSVSEQQQVIEMVTSPNNPDGGTRSSFVPGASVVYDNAYYWPHFVPISKAEETSGSTVRLFTLSKLTGHAGTRIGWAIVRDDGIAQRMRNAVVLMTLGVPFESQQRAAAVLQAIVSDEDGGTLTYARQKMSERWERLQAVLAGSQRFRLQPLEDAAYCNFHREVKSPTPAYAWIECLLEEDIKRGCKQTMLEIGIRGRTGESYGGSDAFVRIELLSRDSTFNIAMEKIESAIH